MGLYLKYLRRKGRSSKVGGTLACPACGNTKLRRLRTEGRDIDVYLCRKRHTDVHGDSWVCNEEFRYQTTPYDPMGRGMSEAEAKEDAHRGMHHREKATLDKIKRSKMRGKKWMPGLGFIGGRSSNKKHKSKEA